MVTVLITILIMNRVLFGLIYSDNATNFVDAIIGSLKNYINHYKATNIKKGLLKCYVLNAICYVEMLGVE